MTVLLPHPPSFNSRELTGAVMIVPFTLATDSLLHTLTIVATALLAYAIFAVVARLLRASPYVRDAALLVWAATLATLADRLLNAYFYQGYSTLVLVAPLVLSSIVALHMWSDEERAIDRAGWLLALGTVVIIGVAREIVGHGSLLHDLGPNYSVTLFRPEMGFFLAALAPGAFIALGIALAIVNAWRHRRKAE